MDICGCSKTQFPLINSRIGNVHLKTVSGSRNTSTMITGSQKPNILVAEDDPNLLRAISYYLEKKGFEVHKAHDGAEAWISFKDLQLDIIVIDNSLPKMIGYDVCSKIRTNTSNPDVPIIMISAYMPVLNNQKHDDIIDIFLRKPFRLEQLYNSIVQFQQGDTYSRTFFKNSKTPSNSDSKAPFFNYTNQESSPQPSQNRSQSRTGTGKTENLQQFFFEAPQPHSATVPLDGLLRDTPFIELLKTLLHNVSTGILKLTTPTSIRQLHFMNGFPIQADSNLSNENLLRFLLRKGMITSDVYCLFHHMTQQPDWNPSMNLVSEKLSHEILMEAETELAGQIIKSCFSIKEGNFAFEKTESPNSQIVIFKLNPFQLYHQWIRANVSLAKIQQRFHHLQNRVLRATPIFHDFHHMFAEFIDNWERLITPLSEGSTVEHLLQVSNTDFQTLARYVQVLLSFALVQIEEVPEKVRQNRLITNLYKLGKQHLGDPLTPNSETDSEKDISRKQLFVSKLIHSDHKRITNTEDPYLQLKISANADRDQIDSAYKKFKTFYSTGT